MHSAIFPLRFGSSKRWFAVWGTAWLALRLVLFSTSAADAPKLKPSPDAVKKEITSVVESQLAAFRTNDFKTAYTFAASGIKEQFPLAAFEGMVKNGYPVIAQSQSATFGVTLDDGEQAVVNVVIKGKTGKLGRFQYILIREGKQWKITGVTEQAPEGDQV